jgi:hypothetical protein
MSEPRTPTGPLSAIVAPIAGELAKHHSLPENKKSENRAYVGAFLLGTCGYVAVRLAPQAANYPGEWKLALAGVIGFGLLLLVVGARGARGPRDWLGAFFALALPVGGFIAAMNYAPELLDDFYVRAFCVGIAAANTVRIWLAIRGNAGNAQKLVHQQIAQNEISWQPVIRRR